MLAWLGVLLTAIVSLLFVRNFWLLVSAQTVVITAMVTIEVIFTKLLHDQLTSDVRAGAASAVSTMARMLMIPLALVFGQLSRNFSVFNANWLMVGLTVVLVGLVASREVREFGHKNTPVQA